MLLLLWVVWVALSWFGLDWIGLLVVVVLVWIVMSAFALFGVCVRPTANHPTDLLRLLPLLLIPLTSGTS